MPKIKQLSPSEAQKIAAGEVVERPANVVKELIENAIDAQATHISIYIEESGKKLIRVVDNGCGMSAQDAHACFLHHATSKINSVDDLQHITTFGFRGEALSSIAAVSKITLTTKEIDAQFGTQLTLDQITVVDEKQVQCNHGTDIAVADLFFNVPARRKFLKTKETEWRQILLLFHAFVLNYKSIHFKLFSENKLVLNCPPVQALHNRIEQLYEHHTAGNIINFHEKKDMEIQGAISNHHYYKYDRSSIFFFVNNRLVKNQKLASALLKGYMNVLPQGKYPMAFIFITVDPTTVDINIHPRKEEVQFLNPRIVEAMITQAVKTTLENHLSQQLKKTVTLAPASFAQHNFENVGFTQAPSLFSESIKREQTIALNLDKILDKQPFDQQEPLINTAPTFEKNNEIQQKASDNQTFTIIGQYNKTYILIEKEEGLFIVDQHAAHERILYEQFAQKFENSAKITLLFPQVITIVSNDLDIFESYIDILRTHNIDIERFGQDHLIITATPVHLKNVNLEELIREMIVWINETQSVDQNALRKTLNEKLHAQMACKAAIKAGDTLTLEQMKQLLNDLHKTANRFTCPHGRPTGWLLSLYEIEKKFKRIV